VTTDSETRQFKHTLRITVLLPVAVIFLAATILGALVFNLLNVIQQAEHSSAVLLQIRTCEKLALDMETGVRGLLLSRDPEFLEPYQDALQNAEEFPRLAELVRGDSGQTGKVAQVIAARQQWLLLAQADMEKIRNATPMVPPSEFLHARKELMDGIRLQLRDLFTTEQLLQRQRFDRAARLRGLFAVGGSLLLVLTASIIAWYVAKKMRFLDREYRAALNQAKADHRELRDQKEWFHVTLDSIGDAVLAADAEGRVTFMNGEAERLTEWTLADARGLCLKEVFAIINEQTRLPVEDPVARVLREKHIVGLANHTLLISKNGKECPIEDSAAPIYGPDKNIQGVVLVFRNATEMRQAQRALISHSAKLEKEVSERTLALQHTVTELEAFSYTVSHDLRSPLRAMQGYAEAVLEDYQDKLDDTGKDYLKRIKNAAQRLDKLIQDLLTYSRVSREDTPLLPVDLDQLTRDLIEQYPYLRPPAADVAIEGKLPSVIGRESALTQILSNLLGNAVKFVSPGTVPRIRLKAEDAGGKVRLWIEDNGIGIAPENHERIFRIFEQINKPALYTGTGVGLAIVKRAAESIRGAVGVQSTLGQGCRFWIDLEKT
jgi:PAS domain S-box-containing protein